MSIQNRSIGATVSIASRTLFFLYISVKIYKTGFDADVIDFFQLLFLQSVLVTFLSASGYFRALATDDDNQAAMTASIHTLFSVIGCIFLPLLCIFFLDIDDKALYLALGFGAGMTSISGMLSGITLKMKGAARAFLPSIFSAFFCLILLSIEESPDSKTCLILIVFYQSLTACILIYLNKDLINRSLSFGLKGLFGDMVVHLRDNLLFGIVNTYAVFALYIFRELWSSGNDAKIVSTVFFVIRVSDLAMQLYMMVFANHKMLDKLPKLTTCRIMLLICAFLAGSMWLLMWLHSGFPLSGQISLLNLLVSQALVDIVRFPLALIFLWQVSSKHTANYLWYVFIPVSVVFMTSFFAGWENEIYGIYVFIAATRMFGYFVFLAQYHHTFSDNTHIK